MSVVVRRYRRGGHQVDIRLTLPDGTPFRERRRITASKSAAIRWGQERERHLLQHGSPKPKKEVPTLKQFAPRFVDGHARANRQKPSGIAAKEMLLRVHLVPFLGHKRLDAITNEDVQRMKAWMVVKSPKTVNNVLAVLSVLLKKAAEWDVIERVPCTIRLLPISKSAATFHDFDQYERLVEVAKAIDPITELSVLLGGEAGLRCGEILALEWRDVDVAKRQLCVQRSDWNGEVTSPKGGRLRYVPLTVRLAAALREHRHLRGPRVLCQSDGAPLTQTAGSVSDQTRRQQCERQERYSHPSAHVLFAPGDARSPGKGDSGACRTQRARRDSTLHAPESGGARRGHSVARWPWQHRGNGSCSKP
jgi:integrase